MLRMYAIIRGDLQMTTGKAASQAGHAFLEAYRKTPRDLADAYHSDGLGTKVVLVSPDEVSLRRLEMRLSNLGIPNAAIIDSGHVMLPHFDGSPIMTALGISPIRAEIAKELMGGLQKL